MRRIVRVLVYVCILLTAGCGGGPELPQDVEAEISAMLVAGQTAQAEQRCKDALRQDPENPDLRALYGEIHLAAGKGQYAEIAFRKAIELGADAAAVHPRLARSLLLQGKHLEVLNLEAPATGLAQPAMLEIAVIRFQAELARQIGDEPVLRRAARDLIVSLDAAGESEPRVVALRDEMQALAEVRPLVASAFEHARCRKPAVQGYSADASASADQSKDAVIRVGSARSIKSPGEAARVATDGTTVLIDPGDYSGGVAHWPQSNLTIIGVGTRPHMKAAGRAIEGRDIWLFTGDNVVVENIEFSDARSMSYRNGAGIRHMGSNLIVRHCYFHDSDNGILTWKAPTGDILIEFSEFARNGFGDGQSHNVYIGETERLTFRFNYSHAAKEGHLLKSRARFNDIRYNRLTGEEGDVSYVVDLPNGGVAHIVGNEIEKGVASRNPYAISFGQEGLTSSDNRLFVVNNSIYNRYEKTIFIRNAAEDPALVANNLLGGAPAGLVTGNHAAEGNLNFPDHGMANPREYDFSLTDTATAIDAGMTTVNGALDIPLLPQSEYVHPVSMRARPSVSQVDVGAHEYCDE